MIRLIKSIINAYITAREFETNLKIMDGKRDEKQKYTIRATLDQMNILTACASLGISNSEELFDYNKKWIGKN